MNSNVDSVIYWHCNEKESNFSVSGNILEVAKNNEDSNNNLVNGVQL